MMNMGILSKLLMKQPPQPYVYQMYMVYRTNKLDVLGRTYNVSPGCFSDGWDVVTNNNPVWLSENQIPNVLQTTQEKEAMFLRLYTEHLERPGGTREHYTVYLMAFGINKITCKSSISHKSNNITDLILVAGEKQIKLNAVMPNKEDISIAFERPQNIPIYIAPSPELDIMTDDYQAVVFLYDWKFE